MKNVLKLGAVVLAIVMVLSMSVTAFASGNAPTLATKANTYTGSGESIASNIVTSGTSIPLTKSIVFTNLNSSAVYEPNISFTYTVVPAGITDGAQTVTDGSSRVAHVFNGIADGVSGTTIDFGTTVGESATSTVTTSATGVEVERTGNLTLNLTSGDPATNVFPHAGIYRYKIIETVGNLATTSTDADNTAAVKAAGLSERNNAYDRVRYLDVYIKNGTTEGALEMYGAVIFQTTTANGAINITSSTTKTTGYAPTTTSNLSSDTNVDQYVTYDFEIKKVVSGSLADKSHNFPFYVSVSNSINGAKITYVADASESFTGATNSSGAVTLSDADFQIGATTNSSLALKHNESIKLIGVPSNQSTELAVVVTEYNDTYDSYVPSVAAKNGSIKLTSSNDATGNAMAATTGSDTTSSFTVKTNNVAAQLITVTNTINEVSPTGVALRVAPYALMLGVGLFLVLFMRRRKSQAEA